MRNLRRCDCKPSVSLCDVWLPRDPRKGAASCMHDKADVYRTVSGSNWKVRMTVADVCGQARSEPRAPLSAGVALRREAWRGQNGCHETVKLLSLKALRWLGESELLRVEHSVYWVWGQFYFSEQEVSSAWTLALAQGLSGGSHLRGSSQHHW